MSNVAAPTQLSSTTVGVVNGAVTVPIPKQDYLGAYQVVVTPASGPATSYQQTYEAENATVVNASLLSSSSASNSGYVGRIDGLGDGRSNSFVDFVVEVPTAGSYSLTTRYANGGAATSTQGLALNGGAFSTVSYAPTGGWGRFATSAATPVTLKAGVNVIRLAKGSPNFAGGTGFAELDSITVTPR
nr:CBM35 domain-containing protein [Frigoribacterium sp. CFBP 8751]